MRFYPARVALALCPILACVVLFADGVAHAQLAPSAVPPDVRAAITTYASGQSYPYGGDCQVDTTPDDVCSLVYPQDDGTWLVTFSRVNDDGTDSDPIDQQTFGRTAPTAQPSPQPAAQPLVSPSPSPSPQPSPSPSPSPSPAASPSPTASPSPSPAPTQANLVVAAPVPATSSTSAAAPPWTADGLKAAALNAGDLAGYVLLQEERNPISSALASYSAAWGDPNPASSRYSVLNILSATDSPFVAQGVVAGLSQALLTDRTNLNARSLGPQNIGDASQGVFYNTSTSSGATLDHWVVIFSQGPVQVAVGTSDLAGTSSLNTVLGYARIIDGRLTSGTPAATVSAPVANTSATTGHLLQQSGSGNTDTSSFASASGVVNICYTVSGSSSDGSVGPNFSFFVKSQSNGIEYIGDDISTSGCQLAHFQDGPGSYYLTIIATSWNNGTITVDAD